MRKLRKGVEALRIAAQHFADKLAGKVSTGDAVTAVALHKINVVFQPTKLRHARQRQQKIAAPGEINFYVVQLRKGAQHLGTDHFLHVARFPRAVNDAAAV